MTPTQASRKSNERIVFSNLQDQKQKRKPNFKLGQLVRTAYIKRVFSKGDSSNWSNQLCTIIEVIHDTIPRYRIDFLAERYKEFILLQTNQILIREEINQVIKNEI